MFTQRRCMVDRLHRNVNKDRRTPSPCVIIKVFNVQERKVSLGCTWTRVSRALHMLTHFDYERERVFCIDLWFGVRSDTKPRGASNPSRLRAARTEITQSERPASICLRGTNVACYYDCALRQPPHTSR